MTGRGEQRHEHEPAQRPQAEAGEPQAAPRREQQERETARRDRAAQVREVGAHGTAPTSTVARSWWPFADHEELVGAALGRGAQPQRVRRAGAAPAREPPRHLAVVRVERDAEALPRPRVQRVIRDLQVTQRDRKRPGRLRAVAGSVLDAQTQHVVARAHARPVDVPRPGNRTWHDPQAPAGDASAVHGEQRACRLVRPVADENAIAAAVAVGREGVRTDGDRGDDRRREVEPERRRDQDRAVLTRQTHAQLVRAVGREPAGVGAAVPRLGHPAAAPLAVDQRPHDVAVAVHDHRGHLVALAEAEAELDRLVRPADLVEPRAEHRALLELEPLRHGERDRRSREQERDQQRRAQARHG